jgi:hypothetical protein
MKEFMRGAALCLALATIPAICLAQQAGGLRQNQTLGFGDGKLLTFTYTQNFVCVDQPKSDLNFNQIPADQDPNETKSPICQAGDNPTINPPGQTGKATKTTDPLYVLIPMFSVDNDQNPKDAISCENVVPGTICGKALGEALIKFFGAVPEGFKEKPLVYSQCPGPGLPPGSCTMHASQVDLAPVLAALGLIMNPPTMNVFVPTPNHSHVLANKNLNQMAEWWQVLPVLVLTASDWPPKDGSSGITSVAALDAAEQSGDAIEVPSNFFLYFSSVVNQDDMGGMDMGKH